MPTIVTRTQWGARSPRSRATITSWTRRVGVAVHHSATSTDATVRFAQETAAPNGTTINPDSFLAWLRVG